MTLLLIEEIIDAQKRSEFLIKLGQKIFKNTGLVKERNINNSDIESIVDFFLESAFYAHERVFDSFWEHIELASNYSFSIARKTKCDEYLLKTAGYLHDLGSLVSPHRYYQKDFVTKYLFKEIGLRNDISNCYFTLGKVIGLKGSRIVANDLKIEQKIIHISDNLGRKKKDGSLIQISDLRKVTSLDGKYREPIWEMETLALAKLAEPGCEAFANNLVVDELEMVINDFGVDFEKITKEVIAEYSKSARWIKQAQLNKR